MDTKELIQNGKKLLKRKNNNKVFNNFNIVYPTTTENIKETYALFDLKDKDILTVTGSGDHVFCAMVNGASSIDSFDINYLTEYYYFFKKAIIKTYDLENFKKILFYSIIPIGLIKENWYEEIRNNLSGKYLEFWDEIIEYSLKNNLPINNLFFNSTLKPRLVNYLVKENYNILKEKISDTEVSFIHSDLNTLDEKLNKKYDYMFLSNIADYEGISNVRKLANNKLMKQLNENGEIVYAYLYHNPFMPVISKSAYPVTSTIDEMEKDHILTLKK